MPTALWNENSGQRKDFACCFRLNLLAILINTFNCFQYIFCQIFTMYRSMPLQDFLLPLENVKFHSKCSVRYGDKKYHVLITDKRIILFAQRGHILKSDDIVSERLDRLNELEYSEKGLMFRMSKISIQGTTRIDIHGPASELKPMFHNMQSLINSE
jgi:hypothetical protein